MSKIALGKGFEGLIPITMDVATVAAPGESVKEVPLENVVANPEQPRKHFDEQALKEMSRSIKRHGVIQPIIVTPDTSGKYRIVAGERRVRASKLAGLKRVPVIIRNHQELEELELALVENVQRVDLSPLEQAVSIVKLRDQFNLSPKDIASKLGKAETTVSNIIRLLQLPAEAIDALQKNVISEGHARAILALKNSPEDQLQLLKLILQHQWSVREAESYVQKTKQGKTEQKSSSHTDEVVTLLSNLNKQGYKIAVTPKRVGGTLSVRYKTEAELKDILNKL